MIILVLFWHIINCYSISIRSGPKSLNLAFKPSAIELKTSISKFKKEKPDGQTLVHVDLYSMLHVGDQEYYDMIQNRMRDYDIVLYELITDNSNTKIDDLSKPYRRALKSEVQALKADNLASEFGFKTQLDMDMMSPNWFIADLDSATVSNLEAERIGITNAKYLLSQVAGRAASERLSLKNFFLADSIFVTFLRLLSWLTPCPELGMLAVDWSRVYPKAGGIPLIFGPLLDSLLSGDIKNARKLAFAQQMLSGLPDSGSWGGQAMSDIQVRINARNKKCVECLIEFISEVTSRKYTSSHPRKIAILYGAYHIQSLKSSLTDIGLTQRENDESIAAWTMKNFDSDKDSRIYNNELSIYSSNDEDIIVKNSRIYSDMALNEITTADEGDSSANPIKTLFNIINSKQALTLATFVPLYFTIGAFDWFALIKLNIDGFQAFSQSLQDNNLDVDTGQVIGLGIIYFITYIQRHLSILSTLSLSFVRWESPLFDDILRASAGQENKVQMKVEVDLEKI